MPRILKRAGVYPEKPPPISPRRRFRFQVSKATPRESPSRQTSRHLRMVRKLSKDRSKFTGSTDRSCVRRQAPLFVMSVTLHERTPICPLKNNNAPFVILVLPIDLRSAISIRLYALECLAESQKDTPPGSKSVAPAAPCLKLGPAIPQHDIQCTLCATFG